MPAGQLGLKEVVDKVFDILSTYPSTLGISWSRGRYSLHDVQQFPAGGVALGSGEAGGAAIPSGMGGRTDVLISLRDQGQVGVATLETRMEQRVSDVVEALWSQRNLGLSRVKFHNMRWEISSAPEAEPPFVMAVVTLSVEIYV